MKTSYIVLRTFRSVHSDNFGSALGLPGGEAFAPLSMPPPSLSVETLEHRDIPSLTREADVAAVAPVMPIRLIQPLQIQEPSPSGVEPVAWGVAAVKADRSPYTGNGVVVAVLDTGIDANHPAFQGVEIVSQNFTNEPDQDLNGHGTHCAGTIFGRDVNGTRIGIARGVQRALIGKVLGAGGGSSDRIANAIHWAAEQGAHVISMSLGIDYPGYVAEMVGYGLPTELAVSRALEGYRLNAALFTALASYIQARSAFTQPSLLIAAAGNESRRNVAPSFEVGVGIPAAAAGFISVGALQRTNDGKLDVADFSNTGPNLSAPGVGILSAHLGGSLQYLSGTSMATPRVAGVAALWAESIAKRRRLTQGEWLNRLAGSATFESLVQGIDRSDVGYGLVQAPQN